MPLKTFPSISIMHAEGTPKIFEMKLVWSVTSEKKLI